MQNEDDSKICLGAIAGAHGVKGEVKIKTFTEVPLDIASYGALVSEDGNNTFSILSVRPDKIGVVAKIDGLDDRDDAQKLKGTRLYVYRDALPEVEDDTWYHADLIGLDVKAEDDSKIGVVVGVYNFGAGDMVEITPVEGEENIFIPFTLDAVPTVNIKQGFIVARPVELMADDDEPEDETKAD